MTKSIDRTGWERGEWDDEPDRVEWVTAAGIEACVIRAREGFLCGYVRVLVGHPVRGEWRAPDADCHGGPTYSGPLDGRDGWWIGFDCHHHRDFAPGDHAGRPYYGGGAYRDLAYVRRNCESLAEQMVATTPASALPNVARTEDERDRRRAMTALIGGLMQVCANESRAPKWDERMTVMSMFFAAMDEHETLLLMRGGVSQ